ncbi:hypothetical protein PRIPAC_77528, partial [Pristionchus pacificus]
GMSRRKDALQNEPQVRPRTCVACGKAPTGYNYGAPSCSSCRAFFRRTVLKKYKYFGCTRKGRCRTVGFMRLCRACRFHNCISGGMNKLFVKSNESSTLDPCSSSAFEIQPVVNQITPAVEKYDGDLDLKTKCNSTARQLQEAAFVTKEFEPRRKKQTELRIMQNPMSLENEVDRLMQNLIILENALQRLRISTYTPTLVPELEIDNFLTGPSKLGLKFGPMSLQPYKPIAVRLIPLEMVIKCRIVLDFTNFDYSSKKLWQFQDVAYLIEFIKALPVYHQLDDSSKRVLLGSALAGANFTSPFYSYTHKSDRTCYPDGSVMTWNSEMHKQTPDSTRFYTGLIAAMKEAELDKHEYALLKIIIICNPLLEGLHPSDISLLQNEKERCTKIFFSYVLAKRGAERGPEYFANILSIVDVALRLTNWLKNQGILLLALDLLENRSPFVETMYHSR